MDAISGCSANAPADLSSVNLHNQIRRMVFGSGCADLSGIGVIDLAGTI